MKSYKFEAYGAPLALREDNTPTPTGDQILVKVSACGVCHSDIHLWEGYFDMGGGKRLDVAAGRQLPFTLGHEIVGEVVALGETAKGVKIGDKRVVYPWIGCGECALCKAGEDHLCAANLSIGINVDGGYADHVLVPHARYLFDYTGIPEHLACTYACAGVTAYSAVKKVKDKVKGGHLLIIGAGGVGLTGVAVAKAITDAKIIVADIDPAKREAAKAEGADHVIDSAEKGAFKEVLKMTGGVPAAIDFVGMPATVRLGDSSLRRAGVLVVVGLMGGIYELQLPMLPLKPMSIVGSYVGSPGEMGELLALARAGKIPPIPVETRPLDAAPQAIADLRDGKAVGRIVLTP